MMVTSAEIAALRRRLGLTVVEFAAAIGVGEQTVARWESSMHTLAGMQLLVVQAIKVAVDAAGKDAVALNQIANKLRSGIRHIIIDALKAYKET